MGNKIDIAIVHYHLRTGGVRRVIDNTLLSLSESPINAIVISGEGTGGADSPDLPLNTPLGVVPDLQYTDRPVEGLSSKLADELMASARSLLGKRPDIWHFHNHCLGKNPALPPAVRMIAEQKSPLLLQIHDFPEDGRPRLYNRMLRWPGEQDVSRLGLQLYPAAEHVHYALINKRDADFLVTSGNRKKNSHLLPNPVSFSDPPAPSEVDPDAGGAPLVLYPTRAIRRKNVGEVLLWAAVAGKKLRFGLTRGPKNPAQKDVYNRWVAFSKQLGLPVHFAMCESGKKSFEKLLADAHSIITTSVAEGFGLCFLEPYLAHKPLCGRRISEITADFDAKGIDLSNLYSRLMVPLGPIGKPALEGRLRSQMEEHYRHYNRKLMPGAVQKTMDRFVEGEMVDFGRLDEPLQEKIIAHMLKNPLDRRCMEPARLFLPEEETLDKNMKKIKNHFSLESYGQSLQRLYERLADSGTSGSVGALDANRLLSCFLEPERFMLLTS